MSIVDIFIALLILGGALSGYKDGFIVSLFSLVGIILGLLGGFKLMGAAMIFLAANYNVDEKVLPYISFTLVFIIIVVCVSLLGKLLKSSVDNTFLGSFDKILGALMGLVRVTFMLSILLWISDSLNVKFPAHWISNSYLQPLTANFAPRIANWIGEFLPIFRDIF